MLHIIGLALAVSVNVGAMELEPLLTEGTPIEDREAAWPRRVGFIEWLDDNTVVYAGESGFVRCVRADNAKELWRTEARGKISHMTAGSGRIFLALEADVFSGDSLQIIDAGHGGVVKTFSPETLSKRLHRKSVSITALAWCPKPERLVITTYGDEPPEGDQRSTTPNVYLIDPHNFTVVGRMASDHFVTELHVAPDGSHLTTLSNTMNTRVWRLADRREVFKNIKDKRPAIDEPFISHAHFDGKRTMIWTIDNSWNQGTVTLYDVKAHKRLADFSSLNGHVEIDVDTTHRRLVLTGTSKGLVVVDFAGETIAEFDDAARQRIMVVRFSPNGRRIAIGSWDNTMRVYALVPDTI